MSENSILKLIEKKKNSEKLSAEDFAWFVNSLDNIPDYQVASLLMAMFINGLDRKETAELTRNMAYSGHVLTLKRHLAETEYDPNQPDKMVRNQGFIDKHSTGGVGDKISIVLTPILAALGYKISKFSGRALGHTGGTVDKLESIPGFNVNLEFKRFEKQIEQVGIALGAQTTEFAPADKVLYNLRDKTGTVDSIPLIASSIMSKKVAGGADIILLDIKAGNGAFMPDLKSAKKLTKELHGIADELKLDLRSFITDMNQPLGYAIGNALEVEEALKILSGELKNDTYELAVEFASLLAARKEVVEVIDSGKAYVIFEEWIEAQDGSLKQFKDVLANTKVHSLDFKASQSGYLKAIDCKKLGLLINSLALDPKVAAKNPETPKDTLAGMKLNYKIGDKLEIDDVIFSVQAQDDQRLLDLFPQIQDCFTFSKKKPNVSKLILAKS
jgi:pyrimidine-nucleoside phosphorylase